MRHDTSIIIEAPANAAPPLSSREEIAKRRQDIARAIFAATLFALGAWTLRGFLVALAWAAIIAIATWPLYQRVKSRWPAPLRHHLLPALFTIAIGLVFVVPIVIFGMMLSRESQSVFVWIEQIRSHGLPLPDWIAQLPGVGSAIEGWWHENLESPESAAALVKGLNHSDIVAFSESFGAQLLRRVVTFAFTLLTLFFLFKDGESFSRSLDALGARMFGPRGSRLGLQIVSSVHGTVDGLVLVGFGEGLVLCVAYYVAGVPHPALLGIATAIGAIIPFGAFFMFSIASIMLIYKGAMISAIVIFALGLAVVAVADHLVRPIIIGNATRLPFLWVLLGILGGVEAWGLLGLFLGPAIMTVLMDLWREGTQAPGGPGDERLLAPKA
jgi:predicted PurR-regulated permease PerM